MSDGSATFLRAAATAATNGVALIHQGGKRGAPAFTFGTAELQGSQQQLLFLYVAPAGLLARNVGPGGSFDQPKKSWKPLAHGDQDIDGQPIRGLLGGLAPALFSPRLDETWVWRNIFVADTDAEAERIGIPLFEAQREQRGKMRARILKERGESMAKLGETGAAPAAPSAPARNVVEHSLICGSPATVAERLAKIDEIGAGGIILQFRVGPSPYELTENSIRLFMEKVAPEFKARAAR